MNLLFIGDIFGEPGRKAVSQLLPPLREKYRLDFVIANAENLIHGKGVTAKGCQEIFKAGVDIITTGNHAFDRTESLPYYDSEKRLLRPANYPNGNPGRGHTLCEVLGGVQLAVVNLIGRINMEPAECPFNKADKLLEEYKGVADIVLVDMHAETTSECRAMGWHLDGQVAAVLGSHTHVQTADEEILPEGTAYITDAGMTGPYRSIIGMKIEPVLNKFRSGIRTRFEPASEDIRLCGVLVEIEESNGRAKRIERILERI